MLDWHDKPSAQMWVQLQQCRRESSREDIGGAEREGQSNSEKYREIQVI